MMPVFEPSEELYPFESRWIEAAGGRVHYVDEGDGQPILMLHGNPTWSFLYRNVIRGLRGRFRCIAVDLPGFGLSDRPAAYGYTPQEHARAVRHLVRELALEDLIVMGHDWGGPIGLSVAAAEAKRVGGVVLGGTWFWPADLRARMFSRVMSSRPLQRAIVNRNMFVERFVPAGTTRTLSPEEMEHYRAVQPTPEARVGIAALPGQIVEAGPWLAQVEREVRSSLARKRALITYPMRDKAFPARGYLPRISSAFEDSVVVELPDAGHYFVEDAPDEVVAAVVRRFGQ